MFQSLASYFYGSTAENSDQSKETAGDLKNNGLSEVAQLDKSVRIERIPNLVTKPCDEHDDEDESEVSDWLLVDKEDSPVQTDSEEEIPFVEIKNAPVVPYRRGRHSRNHSGAGSHDGLLSLSPHSILPSSMEESWFVTPPPCFTSVGPVSMEISPFENLLIEHPSMSVYHSMRRSTAGDDADDEDLIVVDLSGHGVVIAQAQSVHAVANAERSPSHAVRVRPEHPRPSPTYRTLKQFLASTNTQKGHVYKQPTSACRNALERSNKVREVNSKGGRQKRSDMNHSKVISRANNNRKC